MGAGGMLCATLEVIKRGLKKQAYKIWDVKLI